MSEIKINELIRPIGESIQSLSSKVFVQELILTSLIKNHLNDADVDYIKAAFSNHLAIHTNKFESDDVSTEMHNKMEKYLNFLLSLRNDRG